MGSCKEIAAADKAADSIVAVGSCKEIVAAEKAIDIRGPAGSRGEISIARQKRRNRDGERALGFAWTGFEKQSVILSGFPELLKGRMQN